METCFSRGEKYKLVDGMESVAPAWFLGIAEQPLRPSVCMSVFEDEPVL